MVRGLPEGNVINYAKNVTGINYEKIIDGGITKYKISKNGKVSVLLPPDISLTKDSFAYLKMGFSTSSTDINSQNKAYVKYNMDNVDVDSSVKGVSKLYPIQNKLDYNFNELLVENETVSYHKFDFEIVNESIEEPILVWDLELSALAFTPPPLPDNNFDVETDSEEYSDWDTWWGLEKDRPLGSTYKCDATNIIDGMGDLNNMYRTNSVYTHSGKTIHGAFDYKTNTEKIFINDETGTLLNTLEIEGVYSTLNDYYDDPDVPFSNFAYDTDKKEVYVCVVKRLEYSDDYSKKCFKREIYKIVNYDTTPRLILIRTDLSYGKYGGLIGNNSHIICYFKNNLYGFDFKVSVDRGVFLKTNIVLDIISTSAGNVKSSIDILPDEGYINGAIGLISNSNNIYMIYYDRFSNILSARDGVVKVCKVSPNGKLGNEMIALEANRNEISFMAGYGIKPLKNCHIHPKKDIVYVGDNSYSIDTNRVYKLDFSQSARRQIYTNGESMPNIKLGISLDKVSIDQIEIIKRNAIIFDNYKTTGMNSFELQDPWSIGVTNNGRIQMSKSGVINEINDSTGVIRTRSIPFVDTDDKYVLLGYEGYPNFTIGDITYCSPCVHFNESDLATPGNNGTKYILNGEAYNPNGIPRLAMYKLNNRTGELSMTNMFLLNTIIPTDKSTPYWLADSLKFVPVSDDYMIITCHNKLYNISGWVEDFSDHLMVYDLRTEELIRFDFGDLRLTARVNLDFFPTVYNDKISLVFSDFTDTGLHLLFDLDLKTRTAKPQIKFKLADGFSAYSSTVMIRNENGLQIFDNDLGNAGGLGDLRLILKYINTNGFNIIITQNNDVRILENWTNSEVGTLGIPKKSINRDNSTLDSERRPSNKYRVLTTFYYNNGLYTGFTKRATGKRNLESTMYQSQMMYSTSRGDLFIPTVNNTSNAGNSIRMMDEDGKVLYEHPSWKYWMIPQPSHCIFGNSYTDKESYYRVGGASNGGRNKILSKYKIGYPLNEMQRFYWSTDTEQLYLNKNGTFFEILNNDIMLYSPNGTKYSLIVNNDGTLGTKLI